MGKSKKAVERRVEPLVRRYRSLRKGDIIRKTDEYKHRVKLIWLKTNAVYIGERYDVKRFVSMRRPMPNTGREAR